MGLDGEGPNRVEQGSTDHGGAELDSALVAALEEAFGISISAEDLTSADSDRERWVDLVVQKIESASPEENECRGWFLVVRDAIQKLFGARSPQLRPGTDLQTLLPWHSRRIAWSRLRQDLGDALPPLRRPRELIIVALWVCPTIGFAFGMLNFSVLVGVVVTLVAVLPILLLTKPLARDYPAGVGRLDDLVRLIAARAERPTEPATWTRDEIEVIVDRVVAEQNRDPSA